MKAVNRITLIGILASVCVASRVFLQFLPNVKPVTSIIIISTAVFGLMFGVELSITTVLVSGVLYGLGIVSLFQIIAWSLIAFLTFLLVRLFSFDRPLLFTLWAVFCGYLYGVFVSLDKLLISPALFLTYYINGLSFDTFHAIGNLFFFPLCYGALLPLFRKYAIRDPYRPKQANDNLFRKSLSRQRKGE